MAGIASAISCHNRHSQRTAPVEYVDLETWDRRDYFNLYKQFDFPYINVGAHLDVTNLLRFSRANGLSSYLTLVFAAHHCAAQAKNFRYRIKDGCPVLLDAMLPCFTYIPDGTENFINVTAPYSDDIFRFQHLAREQIDRQGTDSGLHGVQGRLDIISYSAVPWIQYIHVARTIAKSGVDSNPKMTWGKYFKQGDRDLVPFSVQAHHGLMDGLQVGRYFETLQSYVNEGLTG
jgi:chloramphenicol O-acetyltransferase type A